MLDATEKTKRNQEGQENTGEEAIQGCRTCNNSKENERVVNITGKLSVTYLYTNKPTTVKKGQLISTQEMVKGRPTKAEMKATINQLKSGKASGPDNIPPEALKVDPNLSTDMLYGLFGKIWEEKRTATKWEEGHIVKLPKKGDQSKMQQLLK